MSEWQFNIEVILLLLTIYILTRSVYEASRQIALWEKRLLSLENKLKELVEEKK